MEAAYLAIKLVGLITVCSFGPGLIFMRGLRWSPLEKLCAGIGASVVINYLVSFVLFLTNANLTGYWIAAAGLAALSCVGLSQLLSIFRDRAGRSALLCFAGLLVWECLHLGMIRHYGGGDWTGDWYEHYLRTRYFLHQIPDDFMYLKMYWLPDRPPVMNLIAAFYCRLLGLNYETFSLVFLFLNAFAFLPCCLLLRYFGRARNIPVLAILFMLNPSVMQNVTYAWTKACTAGFVVMGVYFYLRGLKGNSRSRLIAAALSMAAGILVHYSALPFALAVGIHYGFLLIRGRRKLAEAIALVLAGSAMLLTWFGWSIREFGLGKAFSFSNIALSTPNESAVYNWMKTPYNAMTNIVPHPLHYLPPGYFHWLNSLGDVRDYYFMMSQTTLTMMIGCTGGLIAAGLLVRSIGSKKLRANFDVGFWVLFVCVVFAVGARIYRFRAPYGSAHVTLQPLALIAVTLVAACVQDLPVLVFGGLVFGCAVDYGLGVLLNFDRLSYIYPTTIDPQNGISMVNDSTLGAGFAEYKAKVGAQFKFWGDHLATLGPVLEIASVGIAIWALYRLVQLYRELRGKPQIPPSPIPAVELQSGDSGEGISSPGE